MEKSAVSCLDPESCEMEGQEERGVARKRMAYLLLTPPLIDWKSTTVTLTLNSKSIMFEQVLCSAKYLLIAILHSRLLLTNVSKAQESLCSSVCVKAGPPSCFPLASL